MIVYLVWRWKHLQTFSNIFYVYMSPLYTRVLMQAQIGHEDVVDGAKKISRLDKNSSYVEDRESPP